MAEIVGNLDALNADGRHHTRQTVARSASHLRTALILTTSWMYDQDKVVLDFGDLVGTDPKATEHREIEKNRTAVALCLMALLDSDDNSVVANQVREWTERIDRSDDRRSIARYRQMQLPSTVDQGIRGDKNWSQFRDSMWEHYLRVSQQDSHSDESAFTAAFRRSLVDGGFADQPFVASTLHNRFSTPDKHRSARERFAAVFTDYYLRHAPDALSDRADSRRSLHLMLDFPACPAVPDARVPDESARSWLISLRDELTTLGFPHGARYAGLLREILVAEQRQPTRHTRTITVTPQSVGALADSLDEQITIDALYAHAATLLNGVDTPASREALSFLQDSPQQDVKPSSAASRLAVAALRESLRVLVPESTEAQ
ncbi:hypothetical protein GIY30_02260 [Gordonia sp. HNM0687]|uniref:Uncharacterized protein n=1 Tax=Gordonia mangrovi TaxID=2665643 RepID=A0A6L7GJW1_9ACTN|nr:hypothetical protein [Gordonia mangrovi]MXP20194.1 hypothetical protein [Gordonia mangrovi]UVF79199.1 hypothetical protein NWF22_04980 [Gordonia mangrovi]